MSKEVIQNHKTSKRNSKRSANQRRVSPPPDSTTRKSRSRSRSRSRSHSPTKKTSTEKSSKSKSSKKKKSKSRKSRIEEPGNESGNEADTGDTGYRNGS